VDFARSYVGSIGANEDVENTIENFPQRGARKAIQICKSVNLEAVKQKKSKKMEDLHLKGNNYLLHCQIVLWYNQTDSTTQSLQQK
jgi:hypothetical protein